MIIIIMVIGFVMDDWWKCGNLSISVVVLLSEILPSETMPNREQHSKLN